jgi:hypothetical protein
MKAITEDERLVLNEIRARKSQILDIKIHNGKIVSIIREEIIKPKREQIFIAECES